MRQEPHTILTLASPMPFGKYKGVTVQLVLDENPAYIQWFGSNVRGYAFAVEVGPAYKEAHTKAWMDVYLHRTPKARAMLYSGVASVGHNGHDDDGENDESGRDDSWGGLTDDDMRNDA